MLLIYSDLFIEPCFQCEFTLISRLDWDMSTMAVRNKQGVITQVSGFGDTSTIETLDTTGLVKYTKPMIDYLVNLGYQKGKSLRAAPYDFRYSPGKFLNALLLLISCFLTLSLMLGLKEERRHVGSVIKSFFQTIIKQYTVDCKTNIIIYWSFVIFTKLYSSEAKRNLIIADKEHAFAISS